ncbi:hypothetical protein [Paraherbaspirillum soli]|uniref:DUF2946 domain-containing protein n=1 Tax=Paraherbaspirillum soli TaxID=631222 RepID=A0ABW0M8X0_9BURK
MQLIAEDHFSDRRKRRLRFYQVALWLAMAILVLQLVGTAFHKHALSETSSDCISCNLASSFPSAVPSVSMPALAPLLVFAYRSALQPAYLFVPGQNNYLLPYSQPPPRVFSAA